MGASEFDPSNPRDALAFAKGVLAASSEEQERLERHQNHLAESEEAKRIAGWLFVCGFFLIGASVTADQWWTGVVSLVLGLGATAACGTKIKEWRTHRATALTYQPKH